MPEDRENILIVDDNRDNLKVLVFILQSAGYTVRPAHSGPVAFSAIEKKHPDLILLDILMPEMSGYEVCEKLKKSPETRDIPVIFISALGHVNEKIKAFSRGAVDYITKPFQEEEVLARVETHLKLRRFSSELEKQNSLLKKEIAEREKAENRLKESEEKYHSIFETNRAVKLIINPQNGLIVDANNAAVEFYGCPKADLIKMNIAEITMASTEMVKKSLQNAMTGKKHFFECCHKVSSGEKRSVEVHAGPVRYGKNDLVYCILHDVTNRKILEAELEKTKKFEAVGILAGGIAHDFNNLLTVISSGIEIIKFYLPEKEATITIFKNVESAVEKAGNLVRKFIDFSSQNAGVQLETDIRKLLELLREKDPECAIYNMVFHIPDESILLKADMSQLHEAFSNLIQNAREAMPGGGTIEIIAEKAKLEHIPLEYAPFQDQVSYIKIMVKDHGIGIQEKNIEKIFDPYFTTKQISSEKGLGLGLTTAYAIIRRHNGFIRVKSEPGKGTSVETYIPLLN
jgi:PAS domain S-box-containing protein